MLKKSLKKTVSLLLTALILVSVVSFNYSASAAIINGETCGEDAAWSYDTESKTLYINDQSVVNSRLYDINHLQPWYENQMEIKKIVIKEGISELGKCVFANCFNLETVILPESVTNLGIGAFINCFNLKYIDISNVKIIRHTCFACCESLKSITLPEKCVLEGNTFLGCKNLTLNVEGDVFNRSFPIFWDTYSWAVPDLCLITDKKTSEKHYVLYNPSQYISDNYDIEHVCTLASCSIYDPPRTKKIQLLNKDANDNDTALRYWTNIIGVKRIIFTEDACIHYGIEYNANSFSVTSNYYLYEDLQTARPYLSATAKFTEFKNIDFPLPEIVLKKHNANKAKSINNKIATNKKNISSTGSETTNQSQLNNSYDSTKKYLSIDISKCDKSHKIYWRILTYNTKDITPVLDLEDSSSSWFGVPTNEIEQYENNPEKYQIGESYIFHINPEWIEPEQKISNFNQLYFDSEKLKDGFILFGCSSNDFKSYDETEADLQWLKSCEEEDQEYQFERGNIPEFWEDEVFENMYLDSDIIYTLYDFLNGNISETIEEPDSYALLEERNSGNVIETSVSVCKYKENEINENDIALIYDKDKMNKLCWVCFNVDIGEDNVIKINDLLLPSIPHKEKYDADGNVIGYTETYFDRSNFFYGRNDYEGEFTEPYFAAYKSYDDMYDNEGKLSLDNSVVKMKQNDLFDDYFFPYNESFYLVKEAEDTNVKGDKCDIATLATCIPKFIFSDESISYFEQNNAKNVDYYIMETMELNEAMNMKYADNVKLHLNGFKLDEYNNPVIDKDGNLVDSDECYVTKNSDNSICTISKNVTIMTPGEALSGILNDSGTIFDIKEGCSLKIENGTYSEDVSKYIANNQAIGKTNNRYTVYKAHTEDVHMEDDGHTFILDDVDTFAREDLLGVQIRQKTDTISQAMRFVSAVRSDLLRGAKDYGYVLAKSKNLAQLKASQADILADSDKCTKISAKGSKNSLADEEYSSANLNEGKYKYLTAAITNVPDDVAIGAKFYIERQDGTYVYADYTCVSTMGELKNKS